MTHLNHVVVQCHDICQVSLHMHFHLLSHDSIPLRQIDGSVFKTHPPILHENGKVFFCEIDSLFGIDFLQACFKAGERNVSIGDSTTRMLCAGRTKAKKEMRGRIKMAGIAQTRDKITFLELDKINPARSIIVEFLSQHHAQESECGYHGNAQIRFASDSFSQCQQSPPRR
jgi:hypothetical protein